MPGLWEGIADDVFPFICLQALTAMRQLHSEGAVLREMIDQFEAAEAWLAPMRP